MGFFDFLGDMVGGIVSFVSDVATTVRDFFSDILGSEESYDKESADVYTTERLNEILISFTDTYFAKATEIEKKAVKEVGKYYDELSKAVTKINIQPEPLLFKRLKNQRKNIRELIMGSIKSPLEKRMSLSDRECLKILKMDSGNEKKLEMQKFVTKIINEALKNLVHRVKAALLNQTHEVEEYLVGLLKDRERGISVVKNQYEILLNQKTAEDEKEKLYIEWMMAIRSSEVIEKLLHDGKDNI